MRKKLFAVIMSAMMMITFMPTMAFAGTPQAFVVKSWSPDFSKVTGTYDGETYTIDTTITFDKTGTDGYAGQYIAKPDFSTDGTLSAAKTASEITNADTIKAYFYDLSKVVFVNDMKFAAMKYDQFKTLFGLDSVTPTEKTFTDNVVNFVDTPKQGATAAIESGATTIKGYNLKIAKPVYDSTKKFENQVFEGLQAYVEVATEGTEMDASTKDKAAVINDIPVAKITVTGKTPTKNDIDFSIDKFKADGTANNTIVYDGKEHTIVNTEVPTVSVTKYEVLNTKTGKYEEVAKPVLKDAKTYSIKFWVKVGTNEAVALPAESFTVTPVKATFNLEATNTAYEGVKYELEELVKFTAVSPTVQKDVDEFVKANKALVKEYLDSFYTFTKEDENDGDNIFTLRMKKLDDVTEATKKYAALFGNNIDLDPAASMTDDNTSAVTVTPVLGNELVACDQTKTFHVKKAKALKAKKTFKMKGDYVKVGSASYFKKSGNSKIVIAKDGTVTVKKGLKKGTYKVKVKVVAPNSTPLTDSKVLKVKIVK